MPDFYAHCRTAAGNIQIGVFRTESKTVNESSFERQITAVWNRYGTGAEILIDTAFCSYYNILTTHVIFKIRRKIMKALPQISEAEYEVMRIIWKYAPVSTNEIVEKLTLTTRWNPRTIQTLIKRLVTKHAVTYEKQSRMFVYSPLVEEAEYVNQESASFLKKYYDGNISTMLSSYLENDRLTDAEIDDLRALLTKKTKPECPQ